MSLVLELQYHLVSNHNLFQMCILCRILDLIQPYL